MNLEDLRQFALVASLGSFSKAAEACGVARSTLSRVVQRLEIELGTVLLHRTTRRVELTGAGSAFLDRVSPALLDLEHAVDEVRAQRDEPSGLLRVSATSDVGVSLLAPVTAELVAKYPRLRIEMLLTLRSVDLVGEKVDVALRAFRNRPVDSDLLGTRLGTIAFGWFAAPSYLERRGVPRTEEDLDKHDLISAVEVVPGRLKVVSGDSLFGLALAKSGSGVGLLPQALCADDVARGSLVRLLPDVLMMTGELWLVYPESAKSPKLEVFRDAVMRHVALGRPLVQRP